MGGWEASKQSLCTGYARQFWFSPRATWEPVHKLFSFTDSLFDQNKTWQKLLFYPAYERTDCWLLSTVAQKVFEGFLIATERTMLFSCDYNSLSYYSESIHVFPCSFPHNGNYIHSLNISPRVIPWRCPKLSMISPPSCTFEGNPVRNKPVRTGKLGRQPETRPPYSGERQ